MARIFKRGRTWWIDETVDGQRLRRSLGTRDRGEALALSARGFHRRDRKPLAELVGDYAEHAKARRAAKTNATALGALRRALDSIGASSPEALTAARVSDYLTSRSREGLAPKTLNNVRAELSAFCAWLVSREMLPANPVAKVETFHVPAPRIRYLDLEQIQEMRRAIEGDCIEPVVLCILYAGLRRAEAIHLDWADLDIYRRLLSVRAKPGWQPKTRSNRTVPISRKLLAVVMGLDRTRAYPFSSPKGLRWDPDNLSARFRKRMRAAGLAWTLLDLRHTFATHLVMRQGMSFAKLSALMGNSQLVCARHYAHVATEDLAADVDF